MNRIAIALAVAGALALACLQEGSARRNSACRRAMSRPLRATPVATPTARPGPQAGTQPHFTAAMAGAETIYFETDRFNVDSEDAAALRRQAEYLTAISRCPRHRGRPCG